MMVGNLIGGTSRPVQGKDRRLDIGTAVAQVEPEILGTAVRADRSIITQVFRSHRFAAGGLGCTPDLSDLLITGKRPDKSPARKRRGCIVFHRHGTGRSGAPIVIDRVVHGITAGDRRGYTGSG